MDRSVCLSQNLTFAITVMECSYFTCVLLVVRPFLGYQGQAQLSRSNICQKNGCWGDISLYGKSTVAEATKALEKDTDKYLGIPKFSLPIFTLFQTYSKEAVEHVQEALTVAQRTKELDKDIFEVKLLLFGWFFIVLCFLCVAFYNLYFRITPRKP